MQPFGFDNVFTHLPTRSVEECEKLVALWDDGKRDKVRKAFGGGDPSDHFLKSFRVAKAPRKVAEKKG